jgi:hypothetical protein
MQDSATTEAFLEEACKQFFFSFYKKRTYLIFYFLRCNAKI